MTHIKFPSIEQFRNVIRNVQHSYMYVGNDENGDAIYDRSKVAPVLKFEGTPKLHGTNAGIVLDIETDTFQYQSRERILELTSDNAGFMLHMMHREPILRNLINSIEYDRLSEAKKVVLFGEWCGGNIQKGVAIAGLPKMFVLFAVKVIFGDDESVWLDQYSWGHLDCNFDGIYNITQFPSYWKKIDFSKPELVQNELVDITIEVETECPVGKYFGNSGVGEGVVWKCVTPGYESSAFWFKVKGEKHSASKVKKLASVDTEAFASLHAFIDSAVTEARLEQGLQNLVIEQKLPFEMTSMGDFIRWVYNDIMKEEMDTIVANQLDPKKLGGLIANKARPWFINALNSKFEIAS